jgi:hypothetical protein
MAVLAEKRPWIIWSACSFSPLPVKGAVITIIGSSNRVKLENFSAGGGFIGAGGVNELAIAGLAASKKAVNSIAGVDRFFMSVG